MADVYVKIKKNPRDEETFLGVEYIESTGNQYIQLGEDKDYNTTHLYIDYQYTDVTYSPENVQGAVYSISSYRIYSDMLWSAFSSSGYGLYSYSYGSSNTNSLSERATLSRCVLERNSNGLYLNGVEQTISASYTPKGNTTSNITLFAMNYGNNEDIMMKSKIKIYGFKLGNAQGYKYDLVPCIRKSDQVAGMYDLINKKFYTNVGTGEFVVGATTGITYAEDTLIIDKYNGLKSVESLSQSTGQPKGVFYGAISNSGNASVFDIDGKFYNMIRDGVIENSNKPVEIYVNNNKLQSHVSDDSSYNLNTEIFTIYMNDKLKAWDDLKFSGLPLTEGSKTAYEILQYVMQTFGYNDAQIENMLKNPIVYGVNARSSTIANYLKTIDIKFPYIKDGTYRDVIDKICALTQLQVYSDKDGNPIFVSARPLISLYTSTKSIVIPKKYMATDLEKTVILKNKYDKIELEESVVEKVTKEDANCGNVTVENEGYEIEGLGAEIGVDKNGKSYDVSIKLYFKTFTITIPAKTNLNLNTTYNITNFSSILNVGNNILIDNIKTYNFYPEGSTEPIMISPQVIFDNTGTNIDKEKINSVIYDNINDTFTISFVACVGRDTMAKTPIYGQDDIIWDTQKYRAESITFTFLGKQLQVEFNSSDVSESLSDNPKTILKLNTNELLQSTTTIGDMKISTYIKNNIFSDYSKGVADATIRLFCGDMYHQNGSIAKRWANGEIIQVNDIINIPNEKKEENNYYKVIGRNFIKQGVPLIDLELQEIKVVESYKLKISYSIDVNAPSQSMDSYIDIYINDELVPFSSIHEVFKNDKIVIKSKSSGNYRPISATINNEPYSFGSEYYVVGDVNLEMAIRRVIEV